MKLRGGSEDIETLMDDAEEIFEEENSAEKAYVSSESNGELISYGSESVDCMIYECQHAEQPEEEKAQRFIECFYDLVIRGRHFKHLHKFVIQGLDVNREMTAEDLGKVVADTKFGHVIRTKCTVLHLASVLGFNRTCTRLMDLGADVHAADSAGALPLHYAAGGGKVDTCSLLVYHGSLADVNRATSEGLTPLHYAAMSGYVGTTLRLLQHGADLYKRSIDGKTAYDIAFRQGSRHVCYLIQCWIFQYKMDLRAARSEIAGGVFYHGAGNFSIASFRQKPVDASVVAFVKRSPLPAPDNSTIVQVEEQQTDARMSTSQTHQGLLVPHKIIIKRLPYSMEEDELRTLFRTNSLPDPKKISFLRNPEKKFFCIAFVELRTEEQSSRAISTLHNIIVNDPEDPRRPKRIEVSKCFDSRTKPPDRNVLLETVDYEGRKVQTQRSLYQAAAASAGPHRRGMGRVRPRGSWWRG